MRFMVMSCQPASHPEDGQGWGHSREALGQTELGLPWWCGSRTRTQVALGFKEFPGDTRSWTCGPRNAVGPQGQQQ